MSIALRQNWRTAPSRPALRQLLRVDRLEQPSGRLPTSPKFACRCARFSAPWFHSVYTAHAASSPDWLRAQASLPRKSKHGHTWPPPRACTVQNRPESWSPAAHRLAPVGPAIQISSRRYRGTFALGEPSRPVRSTSRLVFLASSLDVSGSRRPPVQAASSEAPKHKSETQRVLFLFLRSETYGT
jgi:hypothetical protein